MKKYFVIMSLILSGVSSPATAKTPEERLIELGIELPTPGNPVANYSNLVRVGDLVYLSGKGPELPNGGIMKGKLGKNMSVEEGQRAARQTAINLIAVLKHELKDLSLVEKFVRLNGMVNATEDFEGHPEVINGASDLIVDVFGDNIGKHSRIAVGANSLPFSIPVEIDVIVKVK